MKTPISIINHLKNRYHQCGSIYLPFKSSYQQLNYIWKNQLGLSLMEIMVALLLIVAILGIVTFSKDDERTKLDQAADVIEKTIRYGLNESALRGSIIRIKIEGSEIPPVFSVEYGPKDGFVLPDLKNFQEKSLSLKDSEKLEQINKETDSQFKAVKTYEDENLEYPENIRFIGMSTNVYPQFVSASESFFYLYPSGEKDDLLIILSSNEEVLSIELQPFSNQAKRNYHALEFLPDQTPTENDILEAQDKKAMELYEQWKKI